MTEVTQNREQDVRATQDPSPIRLAAPTSGRGKKVWIDIDNSPHVPFFLPIVDELQKHGVELVLTARDIYQVRELLEFFHLPCTVIGRHYGKNKVLKIFGTLVRTLQLAPTAAMTRPDVAISHGSRAQLLICKALGIPTMMMHDYEYSTKTGFLEADWVFMPDVIPDGVMARKEDRVLRYPGLKEDVYIPRFTPDPSILPQLGISKDDLVVTVRPPATEAHYHNPESDIIRGDSAVAFFPPACARRDTASKCETGSATESGLERPDLFRSNAGADRPSRRIESDLVFRSCDQRRWHHES